MGKLFKNQAELLNYLNEQAEHFEHPWFIEEDPVSIPHLFSSKEDIEISAFLAATIAWGQRKTILKNAHRIVDLMDNAPYDFLLNHEDKDLKRFEDFVHRTFNSTDLLYFIHYLTHLYKEEKSSLEEALSRGETIKESIHLFKQHFFSLEDAPNRTRKHVADPLKGSSAKRINMYLRWMVRPGKKGVDFGIWENWKTKDLLIPLDIHTGNVGRKLGLFSRKQNDWKSVEALTDALRKLDPQDPVKYDFALFGLGVSGKI